MTEDKDFKRVVRDRAAKTGESYTAARRQLAPGDKGADLVLARDWFALMLERFWEGFRPGLRGLTDEEYLWEPVPGCPTIRPQPDGTYRADHQFPIEGAATIAQRLCWAAQLTIVDTNQHFGDKSRTWADVAEVPGDAVTGVALLGRALAEWHDALAACPPAFLADHSENRSPGAIDGQFPFVQVMLFHYQLVVQSCSHVSLTRDLYIAAHPTTVSAR